MLSLQKHAVIAFDSLENHRHLPTLSISAILPAGPVVLLDFEEVHMNETGDIVAEKLSKVIDKLLSRGTKVVATICGKASDVLKAGRLTPGLTLNCKAHSANLLVQGRCPPFPEHFVCVCSSFWPFQTWLIFLNDNFSRRRSWKFRVNTTRAASFIFSSVEAFISISGFFFISCHKATVKNLI